MAKNRRNKRRKPLRERIAGLGPLLRLGVSRAVPILGLSVVGLGIPAGVFAAYNFAMTSDYFALKNVELGGLEKTDRDSFLVAVGLTPGMNIFEVDPHQIETLAQAQPWIRKATIERKLPDFISIQVEEHQPAAILIEAGYLLVSDEAEGFKTLDATDDTAEMLGLPMISGLTGDDLKNDEGRTRFRDALEALKAYENAGLSKLVPLSEIHIDRVMGVSFVTREMGAEIRLGTGRYPERVQRLKMVLEALNESGEEVDYILVDNETDLSRVTVGRRQMAGMDAGAVGK
jgi:cell division protein FtsQ